MCSKRVYILAGLSIHEMSEKGLVIVYTGDGKGKTTAALGLAFRAAGRGFRTAFLQFVKGSWKSGEVFAAERFGGLIEVRQLGIGFVTWRPKRPFQEHLEAARRGWEEAKRVIYSGGYDIVVLDEINNATRFNLIGVDEVLEVVRSKPERLHLVLTGRGADQRVIEAADLVTEMRNIKHPFERGEWARVGIDY